MEWVKVSDKLPDNEEVLLSDSFKWVWYALYDGGTNGVKKGNWYTDDGDGYEVLTTVKSYIKIDDPPKQ